MKPDTDPIPQTVADALALWDNDQSVFSVEMGGLGPGYEMAIQGLFFELLREWAESPPPRLGRALTNEEAQRFEDSAEPIVAKCDKEPWGQFSGAQVGAAKSLAMCVLRRSSYRAALRDDAVNDRLIQVCRLDLRTAARSSGKPVEGGASDAR